MQTGWIKLYRKLLKWRWYHKSEMVHLLIHLVLSANHENKEWQGNTIKRGQLITGLKSLSKETGISVQTIRTCLNRLKSTSEVTSKSTNKFRIITIVKYEDYQQDDKKLTSKITSSLTNNQQTTNKQLTTNKNIKNNKNIILHSEETSQGKQINEIINLFKEINPNYKEWFKNTTQRSAVKSLLESVGYSKLTKAIEYNKKIFGEQFAPVITTPVQLKINYAKLRAFKERSKHGNK
jgi:hypothetical protein